MSRRLLAFVAALILITGLAVAVIGGSGDDAADAKTSSSSQVLVRFNKGGGFVGVDIRTTIRGDRRVTVTQRDGGLKRHTVTAATLKALRKTLDGAHFERKLPPSQSGCADCYSYSMTYEGHKVAFDESAIPSRMARPLAELSRIAGGGR